MTTDKKAVGWIDDLVGALCDPIIVYPPLERRLA